jgi:transposase
MVALATWGSRLRNPWLLPRCSTGTGVANPSRRGVSSGHRATRSDRCAVLIAGFTFEVWPGVRRAIGGQEGEPPRNGPAQRSGRARCRPAERCRRDIVDAIRYLVKEDIQWPAMPADFPHWRTACDVLHGWEKSGVTKAMHDELRRQCRLAAGRGPERTAAVIDSQSVKAAETHWQGSRGFDARKKITAASGTSPWTPSGLCRPCWSLRPASRTATRPLLPKGSQRPGRTCPSDSSSTGTVWRPLQQTISLR